MNARYCVMCGADISDRRAHTKTCSGACRMALHRHGEPSWVEKTARAAGLPERDFWRTPPVLFLALDREFRFTLDVCSSGKADALCPEFLTFEDDSLTTEWPIVTHPTTGRAAAYCNPPYSRAGGQGRGLLAWVEACLRAREWMDVCLVTPSTFATEWARLVRQEADEVRHPDQRIAFEPPPGLEATTPRHESMVSIFRCGGRGPAVEEAWTLPDLGDLEDARALRPQTREPRALVGAEL